VVDQAARTRAEAIEGFAAVLRGLRDSVGNPPFREMSGRSQAISHTTLHEAAQGHRLPSWSTTVEFVKACGADPAQYRERWEHADRAVRDSLRLSPAASDPLSRASDGITMHAGGVADHGAGHVVVDPDPPRPDLESDGPVSVPAQEPLDAAPDDEAALARAARNRRRLRFVLPGAAAAAVAAVVVVVVVISGQDAPEAKRSATSTPHKAQPVPADCPMHPTNPPPAPPAHAGDASQFVADLTLPDCSHIRRGQTVTKVWRLKNVGRVPWRGYSLHRLDLPQQRSQCQTISDVPIPDTAPGKLVDVRTEITAPDAPGFCFVRFKTVDAAGRIAFPGSRPVNFQLIVD
jgi:Ig-like domain-containing protein